MPIIKLFKATFYISVCNVEATLRYCKENHVKMCNYRNCNCDVELKPSCLFQPPLNKLGNGSLSKHPIKNANIFFVFA